MFDLETEKLIEARLTRTISQADAARLDALMRADLKLSRRVEDDQKLQAVFQSAQGLTFKDGFEDRAFKSVMEEAMLGDLLSTNAAQRFQAFFEERVLARVSHELRRKEAFFNRELSDILGRYFPRFALPVVAAAGLAMVVNFGAASPGSPLLDKLIGLPSQDSDGLSYLVVG